MSLSSIQRILVPIDESPRSIQTVKYIAGMTSLVDAQVHLFHVYSPIPGSYYDLAREPASVKIWSNVMAWERQQRKTLAAHMEKCRSILLAADFHPQRVETIVHDRRQEVAREIIETSANGYDALFMRRRGMSMIAGLVMGSVAHKLLDHADQVPLVFAGRNPDNRRILIGLDLSENALRAVSFVGRMVSGADYSIGIAVVVRGSGMFTGKAAKDAEQDLGLDGIEEKVMEAVAQAKSRLAACGFEPDTIQTEIIRNVASRSAALYELAQKDEYNTIVVGRKGLSGLNNFLIGRVSHKLIQIARKHHIWIVN